MHLVPTPAHSPCTQAPASATQPPPPSPTPRPLLIPTPAPTPRIPLAQAMAPLIPPRPPFTPATPATPYRPLQCPPCQPRLSYQAQAISRMELRPPQALVTSLSKSLHAHFTTCLTISHRISISTTPRRMHKSDVPHLLNVLTPPVSRAPSIVSSSAATPLPGELRKIFFFLPTCCWDVLC